LTVRNAAVRSRASIWEMRVSDEKMRSTASRSAMVSAISGRSSATDLP
jgi:hypothetical protein